MASESDCVFCSLVSGEIPAETAGENEHAVAFRDLNPQAPTHLLVVPRAHHPDIGTLAEDDPDAAIAVLRLAREAAAQEGHGDSYRLVFNTGAAVGQSVFHCHGHVLAGRSFDWPPG
ncbi:MAG: HIT domain-containing protein [Nocardioidaceae bacterium]|nr:HIT domain-containing protein [Nocardioidaceae bacterium]